ncbi:type VI secretion system PAAR protein [Aeromonas caviae]|uniref:type VI secretion system PAAR protein n=1 Tax=Aeromonas caviae TaxID=648 RepID=UPI0029D8A2DF|nr:type VI secretion system PAAR protein [Aeromonas caviae]MDX7783028.1 type VI secretion system PAAR protein [Aeromonas caviae]
MSKHAAKVGNIGTDHDGFHPTPIIAGSPDVFIDGIPAARVGDPLAPHDKPNHPPHPRKIASGSSTVFVNGKPLAITGGSVDCGGVIIGSGTVIVGDQFEKVESSFKPVVVEKATPFIFAKSSSVPPTTIEAATSAEPLAMFGRAVVLAPMPTKAK